MDIKSKHQFETDISKIPAEEDVEEGDFVPLTITLGEGEEPFSASFEFVDKDISGTKFDNFLKSHCREAVSASSKGPDSGSLSRGKGTFEIQYPQEEQSDFLDTLTNHKISSRLKNAISEYEPSFSKKQVQVSKSVNEPIVCNSLLSKFDKAAYMKGSACTQDKELEEVAMPESPHFREVARDDLERSNDTSLDRSPSQYSKLCSLKLSDLSFGSRNSQNDYKIQETQDATPENDLDENEDSLEYSETPRSPTYQNNHECSLLSDFIDRRERLETSFNKAKFQKDIDDAKISQLREQNEILDDLIKKQRDEYNYMLTEIRTEKESLYICYQDLQKEYIETCQNHEDQISQFQRKVEELEDLKRIQENLVKSKKFNITTLSEKVNQLETELSELKQALKDEQENRALVTDLTMSFKQNIEKLKSELEKYKAKEIKLSTVLKENKHLNQELQEYKEEFEKLRAKLEESEEEFKDTPKDIESLSMRNSLQFTPKSSPKTRNTFAGSNYTNVSRFKARKKSSQKPITEFAGKFIKHMKHNSVLTKLLDKEINENKKKRGLVSELQEQLKYTKRDFTNAKNEIALLQNENQAQKTQFEKEVNDLRSENTRLKSRLSKQKLLLESYKKEHLIKLRNIERNNKVTMATSFREKPHLPLKNKPNSPNDMEEFRAKLHPNQAQAPVKPKEFSRNCK